MKLAALFIVLFGLLTAGYALAVVVPSYNSANSAWMSAPRESPRYARLEEKRDDLRSRSQSYCMAILACGAVSLVLTLIGRKRPKPPTALLIALSVACFVSFGIIQAWGNVF